MKSFSFVPLLFFILSVSAAADGILIDRITLNDMPNLKNSGIYLIEIKEISSDRNIFKGEIRVVIRPDDQSFKYGSIKKFPPDVPVPEPGKWIVRQVYWNALSPEEISVNDCVIAVKNGSSGNCFFIADTPETRRRLSLFTEPGARENYGTATDKEQFLIDLADQDLFIWAYEELESRRLLNEDLIIEAFFRNSAVTQSRTTGTDRLKKVQLFYLIRQYLTARVLVNFKVG